MASEYLRIAEIVLRKYREPMSARRIIAVAKEEGLLSDKLVGKTPHQTVKAKMSVDIRRKGERSVFTRVRPGRFYLRELLDETVAEYRAPELRPLPPDEEVLAIANARLDSVGRFQGVRTSWRRLYARLLANPPVALPRLSAEQEDTWKQLVTYIMVTRGNELLAFRRGLFNRVEDFLRGAECIGFGGHVAASDMTLFSAEDFGIRASAIRELREELALPRSEIERLYAGEGLETVGLLNDDSSPAGQRHLGLIMRYEVAGTGAWLPERGEKSITQLRWIDPSEPTFRMHDFEYWSQLCLRAYYPESVREQAAHAVRRRSAFRLTHLLSVLGPIGSGKTEVTTELRKTYGYTEINSGRVLAGLLRLPPVPETSRAEFQAAAWRFISSRNGPADLADALWRYVDAANDERVLVDGIRQRRTLEELLARAGSRRLARVYVHTPPDVAFDLYTKREEAHVTVDQFYAMRNAPVEAEATSFIDDADAVLYNWEGTRNLNRAIAELMNDVGVDAI